MATRKPRSTKVEAPEKTQESTPVEDPKPSKVERPAPPVRKFKIVHN